MSKVDQFESVFKSAAKNRFVFEPIKIAHILVISDGEPEKANDFADQAKHFLRALAGLQMNWDIVSCRDFDTISSLRKLVEVRQPDLVCTYRHLHSAQWAEPYTLGDYVEFLTQATSVPIIVFPHPEADRTSTHAVQDTNVVMAMTDHITRDDRLVNYALRFTEPKGILYVTHVEDEATFERYVETISKIPSIDTDYASVAIKQQLLKEPRDFIRSCKEVLSEQSSTIRLKSIVTLGHHLSEYCGFVDDHEVDLLVMNTKDEDQLAMHGLAYPMAVQLRNIPLLLL